MKRFLFASMFIAVPASACIEEHVQGFALDTTEVRIVRNEVPHWSDRESWVLGSEPLLEIGVVEGELPYMFSQILDPHRLSNGSIVAVDARAMELRFFDASGRHLRSLGRRGDGPGEFRHLRLPRVEIQGDSIFAWDSVLRRITFVSHDGEVLRTVSLANVDGLASSSEYISRFTNGDIFVAVGISATERGSPWSMRRLIRLNSNGERPQVMWEEESLQCFPSPDIECAIDMPYGAYSALVLWDDRIYRSRFDRNEISVMNSSGQLIEKIFGAAPLRQINRDLREELLDAVVAGNPARETELRGRFSPETFPEVIPAFQRFLVSTDGYIWAQEYLVEHSLMFLSYVASTSRLAPVNWTVFDPDGAQLGEVEVPANFRLSEIGEDYVLGVGRGEMGVERIQMYPLLKP